MEFDLDTAHGAYIQRFEQAFGDKPAGAFVKFGRHMVRKLTREEFAPRIERYLLLHQTAGRMLQTGATINDALVLEFDEAAAWIAIEAPDMLSLFSGEIGDPEVATGRTIAPGDR